MIDNEIKQCLLTLSKFNNNNNPKTWLSPKFSVTEETPHLLEKNGISCLLDFVDDELP